MSKARLIERLKWYYPTEKMHTYLTFPGLMLYFIYLFPIREIIFLQYGMIVCIAILYQGQLYWKLKLHVLQGKEVDVARHLDFFRKAQKLNVFLIGLMPLFFVLQLWFQNWDTSISQLLYWGLLSNLFALLEHVNYYHVQLMVDNKYDLAYLKKNRKLKKASLAKDLKEGRL